MFSIFVTKVYKNFGIFFSPVSSYIVQEENSMVSEQETLIYIDEQDKLDASVVANSFAHKDVKNRAYVNTLGAELAMKYLVSEDIDISNIYNIHSIKKILEEMDISDIILPNIRMDVRVVFDENAIFIPKSHFEYNLVPDIYLVFYLAKDLSHVKFLGFFEPKLINKNNANDKYYFVEKEKLSSAKDLKKYIDSYSGNTAETLTEEDMSNSERIIVAMSDNDISEADKKFLIQQLTKSAELRDKFIEYENFETLSYKAMTDNNVKKPELKQMPVEVQDETIESVQEVCDTVETNEDDEPEVLNFDDMELEPISDIMLDGVEEAESASNDEGLEVVDTLEADESEELNLDDLAEPEISVEENNTKDKNGNSLVDGLANIAGTAIAGAAAGAVGGAIGATASEIGTVANTVESIGAVAEAGLDLASAGLDVAKDLMNGTSEPISLDNIDESKLEDISIVEDDVNPEAISLDDVDIPSGEEKTDFIDSIDNKISLDDVAETQTIQDEVEPLNIAEEEPISLNDVDVTDIEPLEVDDSIIEQNTISFDDVDVSNIETLNPQDNFEENTISFDAVDEKEAQSEVDFGKETVSLENIDNIENLTEPEPLEVTNTENAEIEPLDITENTEIEDVSAPVEKTLPEIVEDENHESFGKNLLDNLTPENLDNISIEDLAIDENISTQSAEDISSDDLLAQIDDVLNSSTTAEAPVEVTNEAPQADEVSLDDIPDISDLTETTVTDNSVESENGEEVANTDAKSVVEELPEQDVSAENAGTSTDENEIPDISDFLGDDVESTTQETPKETDTGLQNVEESFDAEEVVNNTADEEPEMANIDDLLGLAENTDTSLQTGGSDDAENESIGVLFNDTDPATDSELDNIEDISEPVVPGAALMNKPKTNKNTVIIAAVLVAVLAAAAAGTFLKPKVDNSADMVEPIVPQNAPATDSGTTQGETNENILANAPDIKKETTPNVQKSQQVKELKNTAIKPKQGARESYMDVSKLVWDVPDTLSYSPKMQNYLRTAGKSIKLSLSADLLLTDEYAYTNQVKVSLKLSKDGGIQDSRIVSSSGSTQIDNIVLQSVKETLNVVKPPSDEIKTPDFNLALIIYF